MKLKICIVNIFFLVVPLWLIGQPGDLDNGFGTMGFVNLDPAGSFNNNFYAMAIQSDGKIIIAGQAAPNAILMRLKNDGQLDETFGNNAISLSHFEQNDTDGSFFTDIALSPNGKIIALCYSGKDFSNFVSMGLARFNGDGTLDNTFGQGGYVNTNLGALTERGINLSIQSDGKIIVLARTSVPNNFILSRYHDDGSLDTSFDNDGIKPITSILTWFTSIAIQEDDKILLGGSKERTSNPQIEDFALARLLPDGAIDQSFGSDGVASSEVYTDNNSRAANILQLPNGKIIAIGSNGINLIKYNIDGKLDDSFGTGGIVSTQIPNISSGGSSLIYQPDGKIVVGVNTFSNPVRDFALIRFLPNGDLDFEFGENGISLTNTPAQENLLDIALQSDGKILAGGHVQTKEFVLARYLSGLDVGIIDFSISNNQVFIYPNPVKETATINYTLTQPDCISIHLHSYDGKLLYSFMQNLNRNIGEHSEVLNWPTALSSGQYLLTISSETGRVGIKIIR